VTHDAEFEKWANKVWNFGNRLSVEVSMKDFRRDLIIEVYNGAGQRDADSTRSHKGRDAQDRAANQRSRFQIKKTGVSDCMKINILIEQLILDGLPIAQSDGATVQKVVESERAQLLETNGLADALQSSAGLSSAPAGSIQVANGSDAKSLGQQIARSVNKSLDQA
jgi:hypothetical protein